MQTDHKMTERERIERTLRREPVDLIPWATRLDIWHVSLTRCGTLPPEMASMDLMDIHHHLGLGRQKYERLVKMRLHGVDLRVEFNGTTIHRESNPLLNFPLPTEYVPEEEVGDTTLIFDTPAGSSYLRFRTNEILIREAAAPYLMKHILKDDDDFRVVKWLLDHAEYEATYDDFNATEAIIGNFGFTIGMMGRIPFQQVMLDYMGEEDTVYAMMDNWADVKYLLDALEEHVWHALDLALASPAFMVEFGDNFDGMITSPRLFKKHCIPFLQEAADKVHAHGKVLGSHMDGNMKPLVHLIPECGVDVVESFSPAPLTALTFKEAWETWRGKVLMWGAIPSPIFEDHVPESEFHAWLDEMFDLLNGDQRIILGIGDQAMGTTLIERIKYVSRMLGRDVEPQESAPVPLRPSAT